MGRSVNIPAPLQIHSKSTPRNEGRTKAERRQNEGRAKAERRYHWAKTALFVLKRLSNFTDY